MVVAPKRKSIKFHELPEYGLFWTKATGRRGVVLSWRYKRGRKWAAVVYLLGHGRRWMHPDAVVEVEIRDEVVNTAGKRGDTGDAFEGRWPFQDSTLRSHAKAADRGRPTDLESCELTRKGRE